MRAITDEPEILERDLKKDGAFHNKFHAEWDWAIEAMEKLEEKFGVEFTVKKRRASIMSYQHGIFENTFRKDYSEAISGQSRIMNLFYVMSDFCMEIERLSAVKKRY